MDAVKNWSRKKWDQLVAAWKAAPFMGKVAIVVTIYPVIPTLAFIWAMFGADIIQWTESKTAGPELIEACKVTAQYLRYHAEAAVAAARSVG